MHKYSKYLLLLTVSLLLFACDKLFIDGIEGTDANLQGKWQQTSDNTVYYNFQNNLFEYQKYIQEDSILSIFGYYTLLGDTAIYLELLPKYLEINRVPTSYPLDFLEWDIIPGTGAGFDTTDTIVQQFSLHFTTNREMKLSNASKTQVFRRF